MDENDSFFKLKEQLEDAQKLMGRMEQYIVEARGVLQSCIRRQSEFQYAYLGDMIQETAKTSERLTDKLRRLTLEIVVNPKEYEKYKEDLVLIHGIELEYKDEILRVSSPVLIPHRKDCYTDYLYKPLHTAFRNWCMQRAEEKLEIPTYNVVLINAKIPSPSMEKTLMVKDRLFGFRLAYGINLNLFGYEISEKFKDPERFDIVIFKYPDDESRLFIKRVIGLPGEVVEIKDGKVYIDGSPTPLDDSFIPEKMIGSYGPYTVPENSYFMLGDNRNDSKDSRSWKNKFVRFDQLVGKAIVRYYPSFKWLG